MSEITGVFSDVADWTEGWAEWCRKGLEKSLLPAEGSMAWKAASYTGQFFRFSVFMPLAFNMSYISCLTTRTVRWFVPKQEDSMTSFAKHPQWGEALQTAPMKDGKPIAIGFATADIQDSGPNQPIFQDTNWGQYFQEHAAEIGPLDMLPDSMRDPQAVIDACKRLGINTWRTSVSLMPKVGEEIDVIAKAEYCQFFRALNKAGIDTMATLNHFVNPTDLDWTDPASVDRFVAYATEMGNALYNTGVRKVLTFNEPAVYAFQGYIMGEFPPEQKMDFAGYASVIENMMRAHTAAYTALKDLHPDLEVGLSHDPIRFRNFHKWNPLWAPTEMTTCHYLTEVCHSALMRFFQTGNFSLEVPFYANSQFSIPEFADSSTRPLDMVGLQYYTDPLLRFPTGSVTRNAEEKLTSYDYRMYPQGLASAIQEMGTLGVPIHLTEIGIDRGVNADDSDAERIAYFEKILQVVQYCIDQGADVKSIYWWTKDRSWEWYKGMQVDFSWYDEQPRPVADWLKAKINGPAAPAVVPAVQPPAIPPVVDTPGEEPGAPVESGMRGMWPMMGLKA